MFTTPLYMQSDIDSYLVDLFADYINIEMSFGYTENAIALVQVWIVGLTLLLI